VEKRRRLEDKVVEEKEIGSDDDDDNGARDSENVVRCLAEDNSRKGNQWTWTLSDGVMHIYDQDWVFKTAKGKGKW